MRFGHPKAAVSTSHSSETVEQVYYPTWCKSQKTVILICCIHHSSEHCTEMLHSDFGSPSQSVIYLFGMFLILLLFM